MDQGVIERAAASAARGAGRLDIRVGGMSCAGCVRRVERTLAAVPGVTAASVNLATERASLETGPGFAAAAAEAALRTAGYPAVEDRIDLAISGMTCASCAGRVERALLAVPGVLGAEVNLATERARLRVLAGVDLGEI